MPFVAGLRRLECDVDRKVPLAGWLAVCFEVPTGSDTTMIRATKARSAAPAAARPNHCFGLVGRWEDRRLGSSSGSGPAGGGGIWYLAGPAWRGWYWFMGLFSLTGPLRSRMVATCRSQLAD
jgi:hypothetical protein